MPPPPPPTSPHLTAATRAYQAKDWPLAISFFDAVLADDPTNLKARILRGVAKHELNDDTGALADLDHALAAKPDLPPDFWYPRAVSRKRLGDFAGALADCDHMLSVNPAYAQARHLRGHCLRGLNRFEEAIADYTAFLAQRPDYTHAHLDRADVHYQLDDCSSAIPDYDAFLAANPTHYEALMRRAFCSYCLRDHSSAIDFLTRAIAARPDLPSAYCLRGAVYNDLGRDVDAKADMERGKALLESNGGATDG